MARTSYAKVLREWEVLLTKVDVNKADLGFVEDYRIQLEAELAGAKETIERQSAMQAGFQMETKKLGEFLARGKALAVNLRAAVVVRYGNRSPKLVEFGMRPVRSRRPSPESAESKKAKEGKEVEGKGAPQTSATTEE